MHALGREVHTRQRACTSDPTSIVARVRTGEAGLRAGGVGLSVALPHADLNIPAHHWAGAGVRARFDVNRINPGCDVAERQLRPESKAASLPLSLRRRSLLRCPADRTPVLGRSSTVISMVCDVVLLPFS
jgi:hypothetical protein